MPWTESTIMTLREGFVLAARQDGANVRALCRTYGISPRTGYKWIARFEAEGPTGLVSRSRRRLKAPPQLDAALQEHVLRVRREHPAWGARKIRAVLEAEGALGGGSAPAVPAVSSVHAVLARNALVDPAETTRHTALKRFEYGAPNDLWQLDFKGHFALANGTRCYPLSMLDDHSRYCLLLYAGQDQRTPTVKEQFTGCFREHGLPDRLLSDNGPPWSSVPGAESILAFGHTALSLWWMRLGIRVLHGRPWHPQTQGKEERFHRTLREEVLEAYFSYHNFKQRTGGPDAKPRGQGIEAAIADHDACQRLFDPWRRVYNDKRPHEACALLPPARRYQQSKRPYPETLPPVQYDKQPGDEVVRLNPAGALLFRGETYAVSRLFCGYPLLLRPNPKEDGLFGLFFCEQRIAAVDRRTMDLKANTST